MILQKISLAILKKLEDVGARYEGAVNENGDKHGVGKCFYVDGSIYDGAWDCGQRHGNGVYTKPDGEVYKGGWNRDLKHGDGELTLPNGDRIKATWVDGRKQGHGQVFPCGTSTAIDVMYYGDLEIRLAD
jgi:hypothetical protein